MRKVLIMPVLAAVLFAAGCDGDGGPTTPDTRASVRFFNGMMGMTGSGGFTTNGQFAAGSALAFGQATQSCARVDAGSTSFAFGAANPAGTGLSGNALATLNDQSLPAGGNFTVVATGAGTHSALFLLDNHFSGTLATNQAAVRFVNLAPGTPNPFNVLAGTIGSGPTTVTATNLTLGSPTTFNAVPSGSSAYTILNGHNVAISGSEATLNLQAGTVNTIAIVPTATAGGYRLINLLRCS